MLTIIKLTYIIFGLCMATNSMPVVKWCQNKLLNAISLFENIWLSQKYAGAEIINLEWSILKPKFIWQNT